jgi:Restriction endonuclease
MLVYVLKQDGQQLMPTSRFGKVRRLLKEGKAKVVRREPFTIRLLYESETDVVQECYCGVDTGSKHVGVAVLGNDKVLYQSQTELRSTIKKKMDSRRIYRRNRRFRKTRYRKCRFLNKRNSIREDRLPPSVRHKVQAHIDEIEFCKKILPVSDLILEVSQFDTALMKNPSLINETIKRWGYQKGFNYGYSCRREVILHRDGYTCQCCGKKNCRLEVHHIVFRSDGGTDDERNLITLCEDCHKKIHKGKIVLTKKPKKMNLKDATHMNIIRSWLLRIYPQAIETFGFVTSENRNHLQLPKGHYIDACVIASGGLEFKPSDTVYYKRRVAKGDYQLCKGPCGEKKIPVGKIQGFRKFDKVKYLEKEYFIKGRQSKGGYVFLMDIFNGQIDFSCMPRGHKIPKLLDCERVSARSSALCIRMKYRTEYVEGMKYIEMLE